MANNWVGRTGSPGLARKVRSTIKTFAGREKTMNLKPYITTPENAEKIADWLRARGGIAIWHSVDRSRAGETIAAPVNALTGVPRPKPAWWVGNVPDRIITDFAEVLVSKDVEVERFFVALRRDRHGNLKAGYEYTEASLRRVRRTIAKAGRGAYHVFDYATAQAVILRPEWQTSLLDYLIANGKAVGIHLVKTAS